MKKLIPYLLLCNVLFFPSIVFGSSEKVYYCSDDEVVGFNPKQNYKIGKFKLQRFKVLVNFEEKTIKSENLFFLNNSLWDSCMVNLVDSESEQLYCFNQIGVSFSLNRKTLKFHRAYILNTEKAVDGIRVGHGTCELF